MFDKKGVFWFLGLTFGLTWLIALAVYLRGGLAAPGALNTLNVQMLMPAFCAVLLGLFFLPGSPIYYRRRAGRGRWFYYFYLLFTVIYALCALVGWLAPAQEAIGQVAGFFLLVLPFLGLILLIVLRLIAGRQGMAQVWLAWGHWRYWLLFSLAFVAFYVLQAVLNAVSGLGAATLAPTFSMPGISSSANLIILTLRGVVLLPMLGIVVGFGEEYGWRGYLQSELFKLGRVRGVLLLGVIWGVWHWPVILMGRNYPDHPLLGLLLMVLFTTAMSVVLGYVVLKSGSVILAAYLHALNNQVFALIAFLGFKAFDSAFSFGMGIYGFVTLAIIALLILRDPIWRGKGGNLPLPEPAPADTVVLNRGQTLTPTPGVS